MELGLCVGGDDAYQILRGLRTMGVRLERHQESALKLAQWLETDSARGAGAAPRPALISRP